MPWSAGLAKWTSISRTRRTGRVLWMCAAVVIALATLTPGSQPASTAPCPTCDDLAGVDLVLNVLLFLPLGAGLAMDGIRRRRAFWIMVAASTLIEFLQLVVVPGRDASFVDIATNSAGGVFGILLGSHVAELMTPTPVLAAWLTSGWLGVWLVMQMLSGYALRADPANAQYYGQLVRPLGNEPQFPGRVLRSTIAGHPFPDWDLRDWRQVRAALDSDSGATTSVLFESTGRPHDFAAIARIIGDRQEVLAFGAAEASVIFSVRTRANDLHLRPLRFRLRDALGDTAVHAGKRDTISASMRYSRSSVEMHAETGGNSAQGNSVRLSASSGWRLFAPTDIFLDGSYRDALFDGAWLFVTMTLVGYWTSFVVAGVRARRTLACGVLAGPALAIAYGLILIPHALGLAPEAWWEVSVAIAALVSGAAFASTLRKRHWTRGTNPEESRVM